VRHKTYVGLCAVKDEVQEITLVSGSKTLNNFTLSIKKKEVRELYRGA
jgi:hypothetical protein